MRVGLVVYDDLDRCSGGYRYDRRLCRHLRECGDDVEVIELPRGSDAGRLLDGTVCRYRDRLDRPYDVLLQDALCQSRLWRLNRRLHRPGAVVSIVHLLRSGPHCVPPDASVRQHVHGRVRRLGRRTIERRYLETVDGVVCPSQDTARRVRSLADSETVVAPPAGRRPESMAPTGSDRGADPQTGGPLRIAFVGNVVPRKGLHTLVDACGRLSADFRLTVAGSLDAAPAYAGRWIDRLCSRHASDRVDVLGRVSDERLADVYRTADALAVPSAYESVGMVYLEAMEHGTVPLATTVGGADEFVTHGHDGVLVPPGDPERLTTALERLTENRDRLAAMSRRALETAQSRHDWSASMSRVRRFLHARARNAAAEQPAPTERPSSEG